MIRRDNLTRESGKVTPLVNHLPQIRLREDGERVSRDSRPFLVCFCLSGSSIGSGGSSRLGRGTVDSGSIGSGSIGRNPTDKMRHGPEFTAGD